MFKMLAFEIDNAVLWNGDVLDDGSNERVEVARVLCEIAAQIKDGRGEGIVFNNTGSMSGTWNIRD